jgi:hypothetical protein
VGGHRYPFGSLDHVQGLNTHPSCLTTHNYANILIQRPKINLLIYNLCSGSRYCSCPFVPKMAYLQHPSIPFCLSFFIYHSLFDTSFIQFTTLITKVQILFLYAIIMLLLHNSYKELIIFKSLILLHKKSSSCNTSSGCNTSLCNSKLTQF